jgi:hypothetical protein
MNLLSAAGLVLPAAYIYKRNVACTETVIFGG